MPFPYAGETFALLAPLCWAVAVILYRRTTGVSAVSMNLFKNAVALVLLTVTLVVLQVPLPLDRSAGDWLRVVLSGVIGLGVADTLLFEGLRRIGAARVALVDTIYAPLMVLMSWIFLAEVPTVAFLLGGVAVVLGVGIATIDPKAALRSDADTAELRTGIALTFAAIVGTVVGVMLSKPVLERSDVFEVTFTRLLAGNVALTLFVLVRGEGRDALVAFRPSRAWRTLLPGAFVGTYLSLVLWLGGFKWADASVAAVLNQMATVYILGLAWGVLGERLVARQLVGAALAVAGALGIVLTRLAPG